MAINHLFPWSVVDDDGWCVLQIFQVSTKWGCYTLLTRDPSNATMSWACPFPTQTCPCGSWCQMSNQTTGPQAFQTAKGVSIRPILGLPHCLLLSFWIWRKLPNEHPVATLVGQTSDSLNLPRTNDLKPSYKYSNSQIPMIVGCS